MYLQAKEHPPKDQIFYQIAAAHNSNLLTKDSEQVSPQEVRDATLAYLRNHPRVIRKVADTILIRNKMNIDDYNRMMISQLVFPDEVLIYVACFLYDVSCSIIGYDREGKVGQVIWMSHQSSDWRNYDVTFIWIGGMLLPVWPMERPFPRTLENPNPGPPLVKSKIALNPIKKTNVEDAAPIHSSARRIPGKPAPKDKPAKTQKPKTAPPKTSERPKRKRVEPVEGEVTLTPKKFTTKAVPASKRRQEPIPNPEDYIEPPDSPAPAQPRSRKDKQFGIPQSSLDAAKKKSSKKKPVKVCFL